MGRKDAFYLRLFNRVGKMNEEERMSPEERKKERKSNRFKSLISLKLKKQHITLKLILIYFKIHSKTELKIDVKYFMILKTTKIKHF